MRQLHTSGSDLLRAQTYNRANNASQRAASSAASQSVSQVSRLKETHKILCNTGGCWADLRETAVSRLPACVFVPARLPRQSTCQKYENFSNRTPQLERFLPAPRLLLTRARRQREAKDRGMLPLWSHSLRTLTPKNRWTPFERLTSSAGPLHSLSSLAWPYFDSSGPARQTGCQLSARSVAPLSRLELGARKFDRTIQSSISFS